ncbi:hypothetical protein CHI11_07445 [Bacillus velezensis]|nr:hypothetical protein CHI11_07445 [Bacillus velezensis]
MYEFKLGILNKNHVFTSFITLYYHNSLTSVHQLQNETVRTDGEFFLFISSVAVQTILNQE